VNMSATTLFRQLTAGITFNTKKFKAESVKFGLVKEDKGEEVTKIKVDLPNLKEVAAEVKEKLEKEEIKRKALDGEDSDDITVIGNIKSTNKKKKVKKKASKAKIKEAYTERLNRFRNSHGIHVTGSDLLEPIDNWSILTSKHEVSAKLVSNIPHPTPTPVQMQAIPLLTQGRDVLATAPTGSGKTAAFLLPLLHRLKEPRNGGYRGVVVVPTKELANQILAECIKLCEGTGLRPHILGKLKGKVAVKHDILITPPNRLVHLLSQELVTLEKVEMLVVDEADKLFEAGERGFREQLGAIYTACSGGQVVKAMFSATLGPEVETWARLNLDNMVKVRIGAANSATETVEQSLTYCGTEAGKIEAWRSLVQGGLTPPTLVFVQTKERAQELFKELLYDGVHVDVIHSDRSEQQRENTIRAFRAGGVWVLICTELLGRGIDFKGVSLVVNYDFPPSAVSYIHRIGRTGRAGRRGKAVTFFTEADRPLLRSIATVMANSGCPVPEYMMGLKTSRDKKRDLSARAPKRAGISKESKWEKQEAAKKKEMIASSKRKKKRAAGEGQEVIAKMPRIDGEGLALGSSEHPSPNAKKKKRKNNTDKENEVLGSESKQFKKKKKKKQKSEIATAEA